MIRKQAIICDLDGTLYDSTARREKYLGGEKKDFDKFNAAAKDDLPNKWCEILISALNVKGYALIFISGREDLYAIETKIWIEKCKNVFRELAPIDLFMRKTGDYRPDVVIKEEIYKQHIEPQYQVLFAIDDRKCVVDMWRSLGLVCLQCASGEF